MARPLRLRLSVFPLSSHLRMWRGASPAPGPRWLVDARPHGVMERARTVVASPAPNRIFRRVLHPGGTPALHCPEPTFDVHDDATAGRAEAGVARKRF